MWTAETVRSGSAGLLLGWPRDSFSGQMPLCGDQAAEGPGSNGVCRRDKTEQSGKEGGSYEAYNMCSNTISFPYTHKETSIPSYPVLVLACTLLLLKI